MLNYPGSFAWCIAILLLTVTSANGSYVLELVQVLHRTGVSVPDVNTPNRTKLCSPDSSTTCEAVANFGVRQMTDMGTYIQELYSGDAETDGSNAWFTTPYDPSKAQTRAVGFPVDVQAASALLSGIYSTQSIAPAVMTSDPSKDTLLNAAANPSIVFANEASDAAANQQLEAVVAEQFPDPSVLASMGAEVGVDALCSVPANGALCCATLQGLAATYAATGQADAAPTLMANRAKVDAVASAHAGQLYGYNASSSTGAARGSLGQPLAQQLLSNMRGAMRAGGARALLQYAHRVPIGTALGHASGPLAPTAETFLVDLLRDGATGAYFVRLRYAAAASGAPAAAAFSFRCINAAGVATDATTADGIVCPFDDFARFVDSSKGTSRAGGSCYLDAATKEAMGCQVEGPAPSSNCAQYRAMCPNEACPQGQVYDVTDGSCWPLYLQRDMINGSVMAAICIAVAFAGFMLAILSVEICPLIYVFVKNKRWFNKMANSEPLGECHNS